MNKILREEMEYLIRCDDKAITPDVKDDISLTLQYIDELENKIDKALEYISIKIVKTRIVWRTGERKLFLRLDEKEIRELQNILKGKDK